MMGVGTTVRPTSEAIQERAFGTIWGRHIFDPGEGIVVSTRAPLLGCLIVRFGGGERMVHRYWLEEQNP